MSHPTNNWRQWRIEHRLYAGIVKTAFSKLSVFIFWSKTAKIGGFTLLFYCSIEFVKIDFQCIHIYLVCSLYDIGMCYMCIWSCIFWPLRNIWNNGSWPIHSDSTMFFLIMFQIIVYIVHKKRTWSWLSLL